mgnify:CR=1 FL=1
MYPGDADTIGRDTAAVVMTGSGAVRTWGELDERSNRLANHWHSIGLRRGDHVALLMENVIEFMEVCWAADRSGLYYTPINSHLTADEVRYIVTDCGARSFVTTAAKSVVAVEAAVGGDEDGDAVPPARQGAREVAHDVGDAADLGARQGVVLRGDHRDVEGGAHGAGRTVQITVLSGMTAPFMTMTIPLRIQ